MALSSGLGVFTMSRGDWGKRGKEEEDEGEEMKKKENEGK